MPTAPNSSTVANVLERNVAERTLTFVMKKVNAKSPKVTPGGFAEKHLTNDPSQSLERASRNRFFKFR
jgi:hypothetical protein